MSFNSDSAMGMGGSDSRGSIQKPLADWEVIPIGGSSFKETRYGAFGSESSLCRVGRGASHLHRMGLPFATPLDGEPVPVTMILPSSTFRGATRGGDRDR